MFMSYAATANAQYRLAENGSGTTLTLRYSAMGLIEPEHAEGVIQGWEHYLNKMAERARELAST